MALLRKPVGPTSHDLVDRARRALGIRRVGHLGTLDPFAGGLLVVVVGRATRLASCAARWTKTYEAVARLGVRTTTDDATGAVTATSEAWRGLGPEAIATALAGFRGPQRQAPPVFSAVRVDGERAYRRARRGEAVVVAARSVEVLELDVVDVRVPEVAFRASVAAGTYLRALARDLGQVLGCGAHLAALTRTRVGPFRLADAIEVEALTPDRLLAPAALVADLPRRDLDAAERAAVLHGRPVMSEGLAERVGLFAAGELVAVAEREGGLLKPRVVVGVA